VSEFLGGGNPVACDGDAPFLIPTFHGSVVCKGHRPIRHPLADVVSERFDARESRKSPRRRRPIFGGAMLTHGNIWWNNINVLLPYDVLADDVSLLVAPLFHIGGLNVNSLVIWQKGGHIGHKGRGFGQPIPLIDRDTPLRVNAHQRLRHRAPPQTIVCRLERSAEVNSGCWLMNSSIAGTAKPGLVDAGPLQAAWSRPKQTT
jgi:hypothetical protein